jgi:hypothetical protein
MVRAAKSGATDTDLAFLKQNWHQIPVGIRAVIMQLVRESIPHSASGNSHSQSAINQPEVFSEND